MTGMTDSITFRRFISANTNFLGACTWTHVQCGTNISTSEIYTVVVFFLWHGHIYVTEKGTFHAFELQQL